MAYATKIHIRIYIFLVKGALVKENSTDIMVETNTVSIKSPCFIPINTTQSHEHVASNNTNKEVLEKAEPIVKEPMGANPTGINKTNDTMNPNSLPNNNADTRKLIAQKIARDLFLEYAMAVRNSLKNPPSAQTPQLSKTDSIPHKRKSPHTSLKNLAFKKSGELIQQEDSENWDPLLTERQSFNSGILTKSCKPQSSRSNRISLGENVIY